jgi:hypothetical protein
MRGFKLASSNGTLITMLKIIVENHQEKYPYHLQQTHNYMRCFGSFADGKKDTVLDDRHKQNKNN